VIGFELGVVGNFGVHVDADPADGDSGSCKVDGRVFLTIVPDEGWLDFNFCTKLVQETFFARCHSSASDSFHFALVVAPGK
jgi:hypothetical protein